MTINHKRLRQFYEAAVADREPEKFTSELQEGLDSGELKPADFSLRQLFEEFVDDGREMVDGWNPKYAGGNSMSLIEADAVRSSMFANITGQVMYTKILESFAPPEFIGDQLVETIPTEFDGEKIPGLGNIGDAAEAIPEGESYPYAGFGEEYVETPKTTKRGMIVPVTKEAIFFDRTGRVLTHAGRVGEFLGLNKEKRILDCCLGISTLYRRNGGAAQATYGDTHTNGTFDNLAGSNTLTDWTDLEVAEVLLSNMTDPNTGEPILVIAKQIVVPTALKHTAWRIVNATEVRHGSNPVSISKSPTGAQYDIVSSPLVKQRTSSDSTWFFGDFKKAFAYMQNWPITVIQAPPNSHDEFHRDIVVQWKATERGTPAVIEPRYVAKCT